MEHGAPEALAGDEFMHHVTTLAGVDEHLYIIHMHVDEHLYIIHMHAYMYVCMHVCVCVYVCVRVYVCIHTHT